jgi:hypothetical protein
VVAPGFDWTGKARDGRHATNHHATPPVTCPIRLSRFGSSHMALPLPETSPRFLLQGRSLFGRRARVLPDGIFLALAWPASARPPINEIEHRRRTGRR